jgi:hypothetical protein
MTQPDMTDISVSRMTAVESFLMFVDSSKVAAILCAARLAGLFPGALTAAILDGRDGSAASPQRCDAARRTVI